MPSAVQRAQPLREEHMGVGLTHLDSTPNLVPSKLNDLRQVTALESGSMMPPASEGHCEMRGCMKSPWIAAGAP